MKRVVIALLLASLSLSASAEAGKRQAKVTDSKVVREWCKERSENHFRKRQITPYNWTASWRDEVNIVVVEGEWRVGERKAKIRCEAERGKSLKGAKMEVTYDEASM